MFWVATGAVIVMSVFFLINNSNNSSMKSIFGKYNSYFSDSIKKDEDTTPEIDLAQFIPIGWNMMDIVITNGIVYITANVNNFYGGGCQYDTKIINTNNYDVHIKRSKVSFYNLETNEVIMSHILPFDRILVPNGSITSFTSTGKNIGKIPHYLEFVP